MSFDLKGARRDLDERTTRMYHIFRQPSVETVYRLLVRNPEAAPEMEALIRSLPGLKDLDQQVDWGRSAND